jgi:hypothetical protein
VEHGLLGEEDEAWDASDHFEHHYMSHCSTARNDDVYIWKSISRRAVVEAIKHISTKYGPTRLITVSYVKIALTDFVFFFI